MAMRLEQLQILISAAEAGSLQAVAEQHHKTQSAISHAIKNLELELGLTLFDRSEYRLKLTIAGNAFLLRAKQLLAEADQLKQYANLLAVGVEPCIRIMVNPLCLTDDLLTCLNHFHKKFAHTQLELSTGTLDQPATLLSKGEVDLIITPKSNNLSSFDCISLSSMTLINVMQTKAFKRMHTKLRITHEQLHKTFQIVVSDQIIQNQNTKKNAPSYAVVESLPFWRVSDHYTKKQIIMAGLGWGRLPEHLVAKDIKNNKLTKIQVSGVDSPAKFTVVAARNRQKVTGPAGDFFWNSLRTGK